MAILSNIIIKFGKNLTVRKTHGFFYICYPVVLKVLFDTTRRVYLTRVLTSGVMVPDQH